MNPHLPISLVLALVPCFLVARSHNSTRPSSCCNVYQAVMSSISSCVQAMMTSFLAIRIGCTSHNELCSMLTGDIIWYSSTGSSFCCPCWVRQNLHKTVNPIVMHYFCTVSIVIFALWWDSSLDFDDSSKTFVVTCTLNVSIAPKQTRTTLQLKRCTSEKLCLEENYLNSWVPRV